MFSFFFTLKDHFKKYLKYYGIGVIALLIVNFLSLVPAQVISYFINQISNKLLDQSSFNLMFILMLGISIASYFLGVLWLYLIFISGKKYERDNRKRTHSKIMKIDNDFFLSFNVGDVITRLTNDLSNISNAASEGVFLSVEAFSMLTLIILAMFYTTNIYLTLMIVIPLILLSVLLQKLGSSLAPYYQDVQEGTSNFSSKLLQSVSGISIIKAFNQQDANYNNLDKLAYDVYLKQKKLLVREALIGPLYRIIYGLIYSFTLLYGIYLVSIQEISVGQLVAFNLYVGMLEWPIYALQLVFPLLAKGSVSAKRVNEISSFENRFEHNGSTKIDEIKDITFNDFGYAYQDDKVLNKINLKINNHLGIVGPIGSGKSTLVKQLLFLYQPTYQGSIKVNNIDLKNIDKDSYLSRIAYVSQESEIFALSIKDNVLIGKENASDEEIIKALKDACFYDDVLGFPNGIDTMVSEKGISLSGGQRQRLSLARALIKESDLLILDDVLSAVDLETEAKIIYNLDQYYAKKLMIIISHRLSCITSSDNIIVLNDGEISEEGNHQELYEQKGWYYQQYQVQEVAGALNE